VTTGVYGSALHQGDILRHWCEDFGDVEFKVVYVSTGPHNNLYYTLYDDERRDSLRLSLWDLSDMLTCVSITAWKEGSPCDGKKRRKRVYKNQTRDAVLQALDENGPLHRRELADVVGKTIRTVSNCLTVLRKRGKAMPLGNGVWALRDGRK
jgi:hypothetical protein